MKSSIIWLTIISLLLTGSLEGNGQTITTIGGTGIYGYTGDGGQAINAKLSTPSSIAVDAAGNVLFGDWWNRVIRKITPGGVITTFAGSGIPGSSGDGGPALNARFMSPDDIAIDGAGNIFIVEGSNNVVRRISPSGIITRIAGDGTQPSGAVILGDGGPATSAPLSNPIAVAVDQSNNIYIADVSSNAIRKVDVNGIIRTIAGQGLLSAGYSGDGGPAALAQLNAPLDVEISRDGNIYIADVGNHAIRMINTAGIITTIAGTGSQGYTGDGGPATSAKINRPNGLVFDAAGNLFFADEDNYVIRKIDQNGIISTVAGTGAAGYSGDGGPASQAKMTPTKIALDASGNLYMVDHVHHVVRKIKMCSSVSTAGIVVTPSKTIVCKGEEVTFTVNVIPAGSYNFQWFINNRPVGTNATVFTTSELDVTDSVKCLAIPNVECAVSTLSDPLFIIVNMPPEIKLPTEYFVEPGTSVVFEPKVTGSASKSSWSPATFLDNPSLLRPRATPLRTQVYTLTATSGNGCIASASTKITVVMKLKMPNAFTPNNDNLNDLYRIPPGVTLLLERFIICNRWGQVVFSTANMANGWNGKVNNRPGESGVYIYTIQGVSPYGPVKESGSFLLLH